RYSSLPDARSVPTRRSSDLTGKAVGVNNTTVAGSFSYAYYVGGSVSGTPSATAPSNAGTYTVVATFTSTNSNYSSGGTAQTTFTISRAQPTTPVTDPAGIPN